jgi:hypothetical protein
MRIAGIYGKSNAYPLYRVRGMVDGCLFNIATVKRADLSEAVEKFLRMPEVKKWFAVALTPAQKRDPVPVRRDSPMSNNPH